MKEMTKRHRRSNYLNDIRHFKITEIFNYCLSFFIFCLTLFGNTFGLYFGLPFILNSWYTYLFHFILGNIEAFLMLSSLYKCITTSPGVVGRDWDQNLTLEEKERILKLELQVKDGKKRFCQTCGIFKPPRAHHSSMFNKCVHRMDHYCIWVNNVIGLHNQKFFILFLFYALISISHFLLASVYAFIYLIINFQADDQNPILYVIFFVNLLYCTFISPLGFVLTMFLSWTLYLLFTNTTSIEHGRHIKLRSKIRRHWRKVLRQRKYPSYHNIYNVGIIENIKCVFGRNPSTWLSPFHGNEEEDGMHYKLVNDEKLEDMFDVINQLYDKSSNV